MLDRAVFRAGGGMTRLTTASQVAVSIEGRIASNILCFLKVGYLIHGSFHGITIVNSYRGSGWIPSLGSPTGFGPSPGGDGRSLPSFDSLLFCTAPFRSCNFSSVTLMA